MPQTDFSAPYSQDENKEAWTAWQCLTRTGVSIFLTGRAGTGKTTFLKNLQASRLRRMAIVAPTGVAAINAGGVTIHSFFQLPPQFIVPGQKLDNANHLRKDKLCTIRGIDLLVIDEISMVRPDLLDAIDARLREVRRSNRPFGGVQLLMIGDLLQLPPVVKDAEWDFIRTFYDSPYFFSSQALAKIQYFAIELKKIYRQTDAHFISLLNKVRTNNLNNDDLDKLNSRYIANFNPSDDQQFIRLTTHNDAADSINSLRLAKLDGRAVTYNATKQGTFPDNALPADSSLVLKVGAQVMFLRNDPQGRYYNGKIGHVTALDEDFITVDADSFNPLKITPAEWQNISYTLNKETGEVEQKVEGTFTQYPLALAWAITIHKSQGLTFDNAIIDAAKAFSDGQVYVALSRCRSFEGIVLSSKISSLSIRTNRYVLSYLGSQESRKLSSAQLDAFAADHALTVLTELLDFRPITIPAHRILRLLEESYATTYPRAISKIDEALHMCDTEIIVNADKFVAICKALRIQGADILADDALMQRTRNGAKYFDQKVSAILDPILHTADFSLDNSQADQQLSNLRNAIAQELQLKHALLNCVIDKGFDPMSIAAERAIAVAHESSSTKNTQTASAAGDESEVENQQLYRALKKWRAEFQQENTSVPLFTILPNRVLMNIADVVPSSFKELGKISGLGKVRLAKYGNEILNIVGKFCANGTRQASNVTQRSTTRRVDTRQASVEAFRRLHDVAAVAKERSLTKGTIVGHLLDTRDETGLSLPDIMGADRYHNLLQLLLGIPHEERRYDKNTMSGKYEYSEVMAVIKELAQQE